MRHCVGIDVDGYGGDLVEGGFASILVLVLTPAAAGRRFGVVARAVELE